MQIISENFRIIHNEMCSLESLDYLKYLVCHYELYRLDNSKTP